MSTREQRQADGIHVFLQGRLGDLFWCLVQTGVNDLETMVAQCAGDGFRPTVVPIQTWLGHDDAIRTLHER